uniref:Uncharacterized protein n=1 Tax=Avena sativa TaxID=4498 RepID=A0ACD6A8K5_AVESA
MMELQPACGSFLIVVLVFLITSTCLLRCRGGQRYRLPPGPKQWPIIGNLHLMGALPHRSIHALSKRYGPLMQLRFGSVPVVVGSSPAMARFFLKTHDTVFAGRPRSAAGNHTTYNSSDVLYSPYGEQWRQMRKLCITELLGPARMESYEHVRCEEVHVLLQGLHRSASTGRTVLVRQCVLTSTFGVVSRMVLGAKYVDTASPVSMTPQALTSLVDEFYLLNGKLHVGDYIPWVEWLDLQGYVRRMKKVSKMMDGFMEYVIGEHSERRRRAEGEPIVKRDMLDVLLQLADSDDPDVKIERHVAKAVTLDMLAASNNTSVAVEWAMSELLKNPSIMEKATEELDSVVGHGRLVVEGDLPRLPYVEAIVKETLRVHPVAPLLAPHEAREDASVDGYHICAGTRVLISAWAIGRDPTLWDAPEEFRPERFMSTAAGSKANIGVLGQDMELLPFGTGRRMCPGINLGMRVMQISLANLLHGFAWRLPDGMAPEQLNMDEFYGLATTRKSPLEAICEPKLPAHLYT